MRSELQRCCTFCGHIRACHQIGTGNGVPLGQEFCDDRHAPPCNCTGFVSKGFVPKAPPMTIENHATFFARLTPLFSPSEVRKIELAYILAKYAHRAQVRKEIAEDGTPVRYFEHVRRAALIGIEVGVLRVDTVIATILHDTLEDTRLSAEMIEDSFGADVTRMVQTLSKVPKEGYLERLYRCTDWRVLFVKLCDRLDNLRSLDDVTEEFRTKQVKETRVSYFQFIERLVELTPLQYKMQAFTLTQWIISRVVAHEEKVRTP